MLYLRKNHLKVVVTNIFKERKETIIEEVKKGMVGRSKIDSHLNLSGML